MAKSFKEICEQTERIVALHLRGYGTEKMFRKVESIFFAIPDVAKQF